MLIGVLCTDHGIAIFARILRTIFNLLLIIGPTLCIVSIIISLIMVIKSPDADQKRTYSNNIRNSLIALFIVIMLPVIVNIVMGLTMMKDTFEIAVCWDAAYNTKLEGYGDYQEEESSGEINTFVINPEEYNDKGINDNPNGNKSTSDSDNNHDHGYTIETSSTGALGAVEWAKKIAADDSFTYGKPKSAGGYANRGGCYFCGSNNKKVELSGGDKRYYKTYMCQSYITAAYAHGANEPSMLKLCKNHKVLKCNDTAFQNYSCWEFVGRAKDLKESDLKPGDVLVTWETHMAMYIGNGDTIDARSTDYWGANSIAVRKGGLKKFLKHKDKSFVMRYKGS